MTTTDGIVGLGEAYVGNFVPEAFSALVHFFGAYVVGQDAGDILGIWRRCVGSSLYWGHVGLSLATLSAIEQALWDIAGKALSKPVYDLLAGDGAAATVGCYASGGMDGGDAVLGEELQGYRAEGFRAAKIRIGASVNSGVNKVRRARESIGADFGLAADLVQGSHPNPWTSDQAIAAMRPLEEFGLLWLEEPCAADDIAGYRECRRVMKTPIAGGETATSVHELLQFVVEEAVDVLQPDASHVGGVLAARAACLAAEDAGIDVAMHAWAGGACVMSNLHVALASRAVRWMEVPRNRNPFVELLMAEPLSIVDGELLAPAGAGMGVVLPGDATDRFPFVSGNHYHFEDRR